MDYQTFLESKQKLIEPIGFDVDVKDLNHNLFPFQAHIVQWALKLGKAAVFAGCGSGKALKNGTGVLTPSGYVPIESLDLGDKVIGSNGKTCNVTGVYPQGIRELYEVTFSDRTKIVADGDHLWEVKTQSLLWKDRPGRVLTTLQIKSEGFSDLVGRKRHFVKVVDSIEFEYKRLPIDPYTLGVLIGDGCISNNSVMVTTDNEIVENLPIPAGLSLKKRVEITDICSTYAISGDVRGEFNKLGSHHPLLSPLRDLKLQGTKSFDKFIPRDYLLASIDQRLSLLAGLLDTDGSTYDGTIEYSTASKQLAEDVQFLIQSLGGRATIGVHKPTFTYKGEKKKGLDSYRVDILFPNSFCPFRLHRKIDAWIPKPQRKKVTRSIVSIEKVESDYATCISVDSHDQLFVTEGCVLTHNTIKQLSWADAVIEHHPESKVLVVAPLSVGVQTVSEGKKFGIESRFTKTGELLDDDSIVITNYENLHKFDASQFIGVVIDESSVLKHYSSSMRNLIIETFAKTRYKLACTATPSPNDYMELGNHSEFLGVMNRTEMLATFFVHDGGDTSKWRLKGHAEDEFWKWITNWAIMIEKPSDLGYDDTGYILPGIDYHLVTVESDAQLKPGQLFDFESKSLMERRQARRSSLGNRVQKCAEIVASKPSERFIIWCDLNDEGDRLEKLIPKSTQVAGRHTDEQKDEAIAGFINGDYQVMISKASILGFGMNLQFCSNVIFAGLSDSYESFYQAVRRCYRFGQTRDVNVWIVTSEIEQDVLKNIQRKQGDAENMAKKIVGNLMDARSGQVDESNASAIAMIIPQWLMTKEA